MDEEETHEEKSFSLNDADADLDEDLDPLDMPDAGPDFGDKEDSYDPEDNYH